MAAAKLAVEVTPIVETALRARPLEAAVTVWVKVGDGPDGGSVVSTMTAPEFGSTGGEVLERVSVHRSAMDRAVCWFFDCPAWMREVVKR